MARQGHAFATAEEVRVVYPTESNDAPLKDVPRDGKTLGEVVAKGNIVMKEVCLRPVLPGACLAHRLHLVFPRPRGDPEGVF
jgi:hypothetical protein